jgi:hypothetical protein
MKFTPKNNKNAIFGDCIFTIYRETSDKAPGMSIFNPKISEILPWSPLMYIKK